MSCPQRYPSTFKMCRFHGHYLAVIAARLRCDILDFKSSERSAARLAHQSGGLGVASSNLAAPTKKSEGAPNVQTIDGSHCRTEYFRRPCFGAAGEGWHCAALYGDRRGICAANRSRHGALSEAQC